LDLTFFGLTFELAPKIRINLFQQLHQIVFHGKGGYDYPTVYNMPTWLRKFTLSEIQKFYDEEKKEYDKASNQGQSNLLNSDGTANVPEFAKVSKPYQGKSSYK
tara:strand:- start:8361 stop:8672 length:312 start_codon:yes stop_codon:yes gene_type:complete